ncbi:oxidoreductase [Thalassovita sp.]|uniref:oxidoreductase n=1 Tax=Thalassovita sp. TaxID=1979401 RepID=UPI002B2699BE|nr:oxidoreductase [Thalassovita sp.]
MRMTVEDLKKLPHAGFETSTIWTEGLQTFEGVWLKDLIRHLDVSEGTLELSALNEYLIEIEVEEVGDLGALVAYMRNGKPMTARDKGPLWVVFPYDSDVKFQSETTYARSVWQLDRIALLQ